MNGNEDDRQDHQDLLEPYRVELYAKDLRANHGIEAVYLNDVALGVLIEVQVEWAAGDHDSDEAGSAVEAVASGLRTILQELWAQDLVRPVLAVFYPPRVEEDEKKSKLAASLESLRRLSWDDNRHRGDFALREADNKDDARKLLWTLMGDTMGALDDSFRADKIGLAEVERSLDKYTCQDELEEELVELLLADLRRANASTPVGQPNPAEIFTSWLESKLPSLSEEETA